MKEETQEWIQMAEIDLASAEALLERGLFPTVIFHTHLAVEKMLKAHWVEQHEEGYPPRTHDLMEVLQQLDFDLPEWHSFLGRLSEQAVRSRYSGPGAYSQRETTEYYEMAKEVCELLRQRLK